MRRTNEGSGVDVVAISTSGGPTHKRGLRAVSVSKHV